MLSPALSQLLERARSRFGVEVEILDASLGSVFPEGGTELGRRAREEGTLRDALLETLSAGRVRDVADADVNYRIFPLRQALHGSHVSALLAIRHTRMALPQDLEPWSEVARAAVEADLAAAATLNDERDRSRRLLGNLHFLEHVVRSSSWDDVADALLQAAAIWFDADARLYSRDLTGDWVLTRALPGVVPDPSTRRLNSLWLSDGLGIRRLPSSSDWSVGFASTEVVLVPIAAGGPPECVLAVLGSCPAEADPLLEVLGSVAGAQHELRRSSRQREVREAFETIVSRSSDAIELTALRAARQLAHATDAASVVLTLSERGALRRLAAVGSTAGAPLPAVAAGERLFAADQFVCALPLRGGTATLELRAGPDRPFTKDDALIVEAVIPVFQSWLCGVSAAASADPLDAMLPRDSAAESEGFVARLQEELERAKRLDLRLSVILIEIGTLADAPSVEPASEIQATLRRELRGSDLLGTMAEQRVAAVLTHTDADALQVVVRRVKRRLAEAARALNLSSLRLGRAVLTPDCQSAEALVSRALKEAEVVAAWG